MDQTAVILTQLTAAGICIDASRDSIIARPRSALTDEHRNLIRSHKPALLAALSDLRAAAGPDWPAVKDDPAALAALRDALEVGRLRDQGIRPATYTKPAFCDGCGPVWLWEEAPDHVVGCVWCFNRATGRPIPRPAATDLELAR